MDRNLVNAKLALLERDAIGGQAIRNIRAELLVEDVLWDVLIDELANCDSDINVIRSTIRDVMRLVLLEGQAASCTPTTLFGRATAQDILIGVFKANGYFATDAAARASIRHCLTRPLAEVRTNWYNFDLGRFVLWSTVDGSGGRPFENLPHTADGIRAHLGLPKTDRGKPLILLEFVLPPGVIARIPRVVEAYAGDTWVHYFRPAGPREIGRGYGQTFAWDELVEADGSGVPEVVHKPVKGDALSARPLEIL